MQSIYNDIPETSHVSRVNSVAAVLYTECLKTYVTNFSWVFPTPT
jgi:hypothetical protein